MSEETRAGTLPPGGSSMPPGRQVKKVVKGQQYRGPADGNLSATPQTQPAGDKIAPTLPVTGKGAASVEAKPPK